MTDVLNPADPKALLRRIAALERRVRAAQVVSIGTQFAMDYDSTRTISTSGSFQAYTSAPTVTVSVPASGRLLITWGFRGYNNATTGSTLRLAPLMSGANTFTPVPGDSATATVVIGSTTATNPIPASMTRLFDGLNAGTTTVALRGYISSGSSSTNAVVDSWLLVQPLP